MKSSGEQDTHSLNSQINYTERKDTLIIKKSGRYFLYQIIKSEIINKGTQH